MNKRVLIIDNDPDFLDTRAEPLRAAGYDVYKAVSLEQAEQLLDRTWVHVAIVDVRMRDESDDKDTSGLFLARKEAYRPIPKIILTRYPTYEYVREALGPALEGLPPAVDFLAKQEGPEAMIRAVERTFAQHVRLNWNLRIRWIDDQPISFPGLVGLIDTDSSSNYLLDRVGEIEDLFRKLYHGYDQITLSRLVWHKSSRVALEVFAYSEEGREEQFVVICSRIRDISLERELRAKSSSKQSSLEEITKTLTAETLHFAAEAFSTSELNARGIQTFAEFYREKPDRQIRGALEHFFQTTLLPWYEQGRAVEESKSLAELYQERLGFTVDTIPLEELERKIRSLTREAIAHNMAEVTLPPEQLVARFPGNRTVSHLNPIRYLYDAGALYVPRVVLVMMPSGLDFDTIIVDQVGQTRLTDLFRMEHVPLWHSFVSLEAAIHVRLLDVGNLVARYDFERRLLTVNHLSDQISPGSVEPEHRKALGAIRTIRELASIVVEDDLRAYYVALLFCTMGHLVDYDPVFRHTESEIVRLLHGLLLSALLCEKIDQLEKTGSENPATHISGGLQVDLDNREATVGGKQITLTEREFGLLAYLYRNAGKLCKRSDIARDVLGSTSSDEAESWINTNMGRLRKKIGKKYIITVRGQGHKLVLKPE